MAHLWISDSTNRWAVLTLAAGAYALDAGLPAPVPAPSPASDETAAVSRLGGRKATLLRTAALGGDRWVVAASAGTDIRVNGLPLVTGLRVMADRDEIRLASRPAMFFSTETRAEVGPAPAAERSLFCPRCKQPIGSTSPAVRCPGCGVWHHQSDDLPCWTYAASCAACAQATALDAGFQWTPEDL
jgi:hypothetical protein